MGNGMKTNAAGLALIKSFESCKLQSYRDPIGIWTVGWGHTGGDVTPAMTITQARADELLEQDLHSVESWLTGHITVPVTENQFAALASFAFNTGVNKLSISTLFNKLLHLD